jgi:hypothetical protein
MQSTRRQFIETVFAATIMGGYGLAAARAEEMPASVRLAAPGPMHEPFKYLAGSWKVSMTVYPGPDLYPVKSDQMEAKRELLLGGRYLREELTGTFAGAPSSRLGILGYNALDERYEFVTFDTFEPGMMPYQGQRTAEGVLELMGESTEAGMGAEPTGRKRMLRFEWSISPDESVQKIFSKYPAEPEFLFVEQRYVQQS